MDKKLFQKNMLSVLVIVVGGFVLFNAVFLLAAFVMNASTRVFGMPEGAAPYFLSRVLFLILVFMISSGVFKSRLNTLAKATFLTMPLMVVLVMVGMVLYQQPKFLQIGIGTLIISAAIYYLYKKTLSWHYYFSVLYVAVLSLCIILFDIQI